MADSKSPAKKVLANAWLEAAAGKKVHSTLLVDSAQVLPEETKKIEENSFAHSETDTAQEADASASQTSAETSLSESRSDVDASKQRQGILRNLDKLAFPVLPQTPMAINLDQAWQGYPNEKRFRQQRDAATEARLSMKLKAKLSESYQKLAESSANAQASSKAAFNGVTERFEIYFVDIKDGAMHIVAKLGEQIVFVKAKVTDIVGPPVEAIKDRSYQLGSKGRARIQGARARIDDASGKVKGVIQDGYVHIITTVDGQVVCIKAKTCEVTDCVKNKAIETYGMVAKSVDDFTVPVRTKAVALGESSKSTVLSVKSKASAVYGLAETRVVSVYDASVAKVSPVFLPLKPYYVKAHNGVTIIFAKVGDTYMLVQVKIVDAYTSVHAQTVRSIEGARAVVEGCVSPFANRAFDAFTDTRVGVVTTVELLNIRFNNGLIYVKGKTGDAICAAQDLALRSVNNTKRAIFDMKELVQTTLSTLYGKACDNLKLLGTASKDGFMYIAVQVNDKIFVMNVKIAEVVEFVKAKSTEGLHALVNKCSTGRAAALEALGAAKTSVSTNGRSLVANPKARVTAASAAGGAVALGASGGATGLVAGGVVGAACAVPAAFFTFGLSIPVGVFLGAGAGLCVGTAAGGTAGLVSGGAAGFGAHTAHSHKDELKSKARAYKEIASASSIKLRSSVMAAVGSTGGTVASIAGA